MSEPSCFSLNDCTENNEQLLKAMGFNDEKEIKQALCMSNNDINEAVAILTNEKLPKITTLNSNNDIENDIDMIDVNNLGSQNSTDQCPLKFPYDALIQLENNVFTDNWSIPYKKDEWLERLLVSTIALLKEKIAELDENCKKFLDRVFPEVYKKLHDSAPVKNWTNEIQQGVYNMTLLALELIAIRTSQEGVPEYLLNTLSLIFNTDTTFQSKNLNRNWDQSLIDALETESFARFADSNGWLIDFINTFAFHKGFDAIKSQLEKSNDIYEFNVLLKPLATCSSFLNSQLILNYFENSIRRIYEFIKAMSDEDFKDKNAGKVFDLLHTIKKLCSGVWPSVIDEFNTLHLNTILNMLKYSHFNSKMNSLKEICKLIDNNNSSMNVSKLIIKEEKLSEWIITEKILSLAVEGNIDQSQYCDKIKTIVEFIGDRIKTEEISALWDMQHNKSISIIDNLYMIIGISATKFNSEQLDYLLAQLIKSWNNSSFKLHDKLIGLLSLIGSQAKSNKTCSRILEALWELRNRPGLNRQLLLLIYTEHLTVLSGGRLPREAAKRDYLKKCCDDIKKSPGSSVAIASLRHMYDILNSYQKNSQKALKEVLTELVVPIMKNLCQSLLKCHSNAYEKAKLTSRKFDQTALIDGLFTHEEAVQSHLNSMKFILQEGNLYLNLNRAIDIWQTLITNEHSCDWDKRIGFEWFIDCLPDLNDDSRIEIFKKHILNLQPSKLSMKGYECFKLYFIRVNEHESKIQIKTDIDNFLVDKLDLIGLQFIWDIILCVHDEQIADVATKFLLEISYEKVTPKIKRESASLHQRFINECYSRLEKCLISLDSSSPIGQLLLNAFKITYVTTFQQADVDQQVPIASRAHTLKCIERILMIAERYIVKVEETTSSTNSSQLQISRLNMPHFLTFKSESFTLTCVCESTTTTQSVLLLPFNRQSIDLFVCSNETLGELRSKIANSLQVSMNNLQIYNNDKLLNVLNDQKLLTQLNIDGMNSLNVKITSTYPSSLNQTPVKDSQILSFHSSSSRQQDPELEKSLPGVIIANSNGGSAFDMLHRLEDLNEPRINCRVRNILKIIPTNPKLLESFERITANIGRSMGGASGSGGDSGSASSSSLQSAASASATASSSSTLVKSPSVSIMNNNAGNLSNQIKQLTTQSTPTTPTVSAATAAASSAAGSSFSYVTSSVNAVTSLFMKRTDSSTSLDSRSSLTNITTTTTTTTNNNNNNNITPDTDTKDYNKFFDKTLPLHRILYNLEALSSKLMPSYSAQNNNNNSTELNNTDLFQQDFLRANGLETLIQLLKLENFTSTTCNSTTTNISSNRSSKSSEYETKQDVYILLLQLLRLIYFGSYHPINTVLPMVNVNEQANQKRPSSEPLQTCGAKKTIFPSMVDNNQNLPVNKNNNNNILDNSNSSTTNTLINTTSFSSTNTAITTTTNETKLNLIEKMNSSEVTDMLIQLLLICWASSAGNLQYAYTNPNIVSSSRTISNSSNGSSKQTNEDLVDTNDVQTATKQATKEVKFCIQDHRLSTGSNMSTSSMDSSEQQQQHQNHPNHQQYSPSINSGQLHSGICIKQTFISNKDIKIALKAIEMISCFLHHRKDAISSFLSLKIFSECVIDVLTGSISNKIRVYMKKFLLKLGQLEMQSSFKCKDFLINLIIKSRLPLWVNSSISRTSTQRLILQSTQYFSLRSKLFTNMTQLEQQTYSIDLKKMLNDESNWFLIFSPTRNLKNVDNILLAGHFSLTKALLTCETANKIEFGAKIIPLLIRTYLFPAAHLISDPAADSANSENSMDPICSDESTRIAAYKLLVELSRNCLANYQLISKQLINFHHSQNPASMSSDWNYIPLVTPRAECGYVGLKNGGATCYMNAILQQLYMMPGVPEYLLSIDSSDDLQDKMSVFYQLQNVFAHLKESKLEYHVPEQFWKAFRMWGQEVNIREQQDAYDFFISMTDQIDEYLKKMNKEPIFKNILEGTFSNQFICTDCPHRYEREEAFLGLNLPIKSGSLEESLLQFVKDELLDGENAYNCEKCNEKRSAIKRTCIKKLPKYLCIQLKRFDYDWESNRSLKFDDYFQFPRALDLAPYMYESINKTRQTNSFSKNKNKNPNSTSLTDLDDDDNDENDPDSYHKMETSNNLMSNSASLLSQSLPTQTVQFKKKLSMTAKSIEQKDVLYELVGIVVHSGQANAGHYYSFIKGFNNDQNLIQQELEELQERDLLLEEEDENSSCFLSSQEEQSNSARKEKLNTFNEKTDKWFKFNDTGVEEICLNENTLIEECFGGTFQQSSDFKMLPEERVRYWNGYMLFYREANYNGLFQQDVLRNANNRLKQQKKEQFISKSKVSGDSLSELAELVSKGDEKGLFRMSLPASIEQIVKSENLEFCKNRTIYDHDYFHFIYEMVKISKDIYDEENKEIENNELFISNSCNLGLEFLYNTFFKTGKKLRIDLNKWLDLFKELMSFSQESAKSMLNFIVEHEINSNFLRHYLLECPINEIRDACAQLFDYFFNSLIIQFNFNPLNDTKITSLISSFVQLLDKAVIDLCKNSHEYFKVLYGYADLNKDTTKQLISLSLFSKLLCFLLGNPGSVKGEETSNRRWNTIQSREFAIVHELIAILVLKCNVFSLKTCEDTQPANVSTTAESNTENNENIKEINTDIYDSNNIFKKNLDNDSFKTSSFVFQPPVNTDDLIVLPQEMQIYLIGALSNRYLKELVFAFEQINASLLPKTLEMILSCCYCNEPFSANIIHQILTHVNNSSFNEIKQVLSLLNNIILIEDPLQLKRLQLAIDGYKDDETVYNGLLNIVRQNQGSDAKKSYQCVKLIVTLANTSNSCKDYLLKTAHNWEWSVNWLKRKMLDSNFTSWTLSKSNEDSESRTFQRTKSAQRTLDDATALLKSGNEND